jgi:drug/metabolite transporter (DMT)-like permease
MAARSDLEPASRAQVWIALAAVYVIWGSTYLGIWYAVQTLPPFLMAAARFLTAGVLMYAWARPRAERPTLANWRATAIVGGLLLAGGNGGVVWAEQHVPSGIAALLVATLSLWMVLLEWLTGGPRPTLRAVLGLLIGFGGLALLVGPGEGLGGAGVDPLGAGVLVLASLLWAIGSVYSRGAPMPKSPLLGTGMEMLAGGALLLVFGSITGEWARLDLAAVSRESWLGLLYLIGFGSMIGYTAYVWLLRHAPLSLVSTYAYVNPVVAVLLGWLIAGEPLTARTLLAAGIIVAAVVVITTAPRASRIARDTGEPGVGVEVRSA